jgi:acetylornithine deacetylase
VCVVEGGIADNVVPEDCRFHYEFRNLPGEEVAALQARVLAAAAALEPGMKAVEPSSGFRFEASCEMPAFRAPADDAAVRLALSLAGTRETTNVAFGTEAGLYQGAGMATVVCGPGSIAQAHQADEFVSLAQLAHCETFLKGIVSRVEA